MKYYKIENYENINQVVTNKTFLLTDLEKKDWETDSYVRQIYFTTPNIKKMNVFCLITFRPNKIWCDFLNLFNKYKIFIVVDNNNFDLYDFKNNYKNINFIQITDEKCKLNGYIDTNFTLKTEMINEN